MWMELSVGVEEGAKVSITAADGIKVQGPVSVAFQALTPQGPKEPFTLLVNVSAAISASVLQNGT